MSNQKTDRRIVRTKKVIRDALTDLIEEKGFELITVRDLTEKADINRGTFYLHYQDKYDLLKKSEDELIEGMRDFIHGITPGGIIQSNLQEEPLPFLVKLFEYIEENARYMKLILGPNGDPSFQDRIKQFMKANFIDKIMKDLKEDELLVPVEYLMSYVTAAHLGVIQQWLESDMQQSPEEMALILVKISFFGPAHVAGLKKE